MIAHSVVGQIELCSRINPFACDAARLAPFSRRGSVVAITFDATLRYADVMPTKRPAETLVV